MCNKSPRQMKKRKKKQRNLLPEYVVYSGVLVFFLFSVTALVCYIYIPTFTIPFHTERDII